MLFIGVDPSVHGGIAILNGEDSKLVAIHPMPIIGDKEYDIQHIKEILRQAGKSNCFGVIEKQHPMPGEGLPRTFKTGFGFGMLLGMFASLEIPHQVVVAKVWQARLFKGLPLKQDTKVSSGVVAQRLFPGVVFRASEKSKVMHDGMTDAACIASYARFLYTNNSEEPTPTHNHIVLAENPMVCIKCGELVTT